MKPPEEYLRVPCVEHAPKNATMSEHCRECEVAGIAQAQRDALEEAAQVCLHYQHSANICFGLAAAIRAIISGVPWR